jgi:hypothetical protein
MAVKKRDDNSPEAIAAERERRRLKGLARGEQRLNPDLKYTQALRIVKDREAAEKKTLRTMDTGV